MNVVLKNCVSENNKLDKSFTSSTSTFSFEFKDSSSVFTPSILIGTTENLTSYNYAEISDLNRKYFITDIVMVRANLYLLKLKTDVLSTWASSIRSLNAVLKRQENEYNLYLDDPEFKVYNYETVTTHEFPSGFDKNLSFILSVSGN